MKAFLLSFRYAAEGLIFVMRTQRNARIHLLISILVIGLGLFFGISATEWAVIFLTIGLVLSAEVLNTVAEVAVDVLVQRFDPRAKIAKDAGAGAVLIAAIAAVGVGLAIFGPRLWRLVARP